MPRKSRGGGKSRKLNARSTPEDRPLDVQGRKQTLLPSLVSAVTLWAAFPPLALYLLAWLAPIGWLTCCLDKRPISRGGYFAIWLSGFLFWLALLQGVRLAYWPLYFGWLAISLYLSFYTPLFVSAARTLHHQLRWPLVLAASVAWTGIEVLRSYLFTGFASNTLAHTQYRAPVVIQISDQLGGFGVSFVLIATCATILRIATSWKIQRAAVVQEAIVSSLLVLAALGYGSWRLAQADELAKQPPLLEVLLVQENTPTMFDADLDRMQAAWTRYLETTKRLIAETGTPDLVVWPETTFNGGYPWYANVPEVIPASVSNDSERYRDRAGEFMSYAELKLSLFLAAVKGEPYTYGAPPTPAEKPHALLGCGTIVITETDSKDYNSALFVTPEGKIAGRYDKMHRVMFGEYVPLGPALEWLRDMFGLRLDAGKEPKCFEVAGTSFSPSICFESMMPRLISRQVRELTQAGTPPEVLINITNDSWFHGSSILDHHIACATFCAVENRRPVLVAANTGLSASIDGSGRILEKTQRQVGAGIWAEPTRDSRPALVQLAGYPLAWLCAIITTAALGLGFYRLRVGSNEVS